MTDASSSLRDRVLDRDDDLRDALQLLLQRANRRQMWMMFMDDRGCLGQPLIPIEDYPDDADEVVDVADLGRVTQAHVFMHRAGRLCQMTENASVVLVWERIGSSAVSPEDRSWARAMADAAGVLDVPLRAQFVVHGRGVRQLHPDDYL
ncbi:hypothetical protein [Microbacterium murale]|uniref:Uncharacterized protein n=1 Tax=Microbacterium murale TaxID=1081040 RepID=A0ABU0P6D5_9MICO|nr:hypothetical protein [Microbacterium murale]MDQ0642885.1 hypothetical protein [Microbacterium murale]